MKQNSSYLYQYLVDSVLVNQAFPPVVCRRHLDAYPDSAWVYASTTIPMDVSEAVHISMLKHGFWDWHYCFSCILSFDWPYLSIIYSPSLQSELVSSFLSRCSGLSYRWMAYSDSSFYRSTFLKIKLKSKIITLINN